MGTGAMSAERIVRATGCPPVTTISTIPLRHASAASHEAAFAVKCANRIDSRSSCYEPNLYLMADVLRLDRTVRLDLLIVELYRTVPSQINLEP